MKYTVYKLYFTSPLHISDKGSRQVTDIWNYIHSDTLASMLSYAYGITKDDNIREFLEKIKISSAFPFVETGGKSTYFFPVPRGFGIKNADISIRKKVKKVRWFDKETWEIIIQGREPETFRNLEGKITGSFFTNNTESTGVIKKSFKTEIRMRVQISRNPAEDNLPYGNSGIYFINTEEEKSGLFFLVEKDEDNLIPDLLEVLKDTGIGAYKSIGYGAFYWEKDELEITFPEGSEYYTNLGLYLPQTPQELENSLTDYEITLRSGWVSVDGHMNLRRNGVYMFQEGSVFKFGAEAPEGNILKVVDKPIEIFRYGKGFFVPINKKL